MGTGQLGQQELNQISERIIGCAYRVSNELGSGFLEKVYESALAYELIRSGLQTKRQCPITVKYDGVIVGEFCADLLVESCVLVELKAAKAFDENHMAQCINYLRATGLKLCLLINFGTPRVQIKRIAN